MSDTKTDQQSTLRSPVPIRPWSSPLFRWAGSKRQLLPTLMAATPTSFQRYIEPFAGSACLFFALKPKRAILGEINPHLLHAYETIRTHPRLVYRAAAAIPNTKHHYYKLRNRDPDSLPDIERAARFVYLNRYCFNGVYRTNRKGAFNVPRGSSTGSLPSEQHFYRCAVALRACELKCMDFGDTLDSVATGDFIYLDPPYSNSQRKTFGEYGYGVFAHMDHARLVTLLTRIDVVGAHFLLSYCIDNTLKDLLPPRWTIRELKVRRNIAGFADHRRIATEILISNY